MPSTTIEQVQKREAKLKQAIAGLGEAPDIANKRELGKQLRRAQRLRRRLATEDERRVKTAAKPAAEKPAVPAAAPAEEVAADKAPAEEAPAEEVAAEEAPAKETAK